jgi:hypothetical protein
MGLSLISHVSLLVSLFTAFTKLQDQNTVTVIPTRGHLECTVKKISQKGPSAVPWAPFCLACRRPLTVPISEYFRRPSNGWSRLPNGFELTYFGLRRLRISRRPGLHQGRRINTGGSPAGV